MHEVLSFLRARRALVLFGLYAVLMPLVVGYLTTTRLGYVSFLIAFGLCCAVAAEAVRYVGRVRALRKLLEQGGTGPLPEGGDECDELYRALYQAQNETMQALRTAQAQRAADNEAYYTQWVHQIKTPIAAMRMVLARHEDAQTGTLQQELFKIEQYAQMALQYVRLRDVAADLAPQRCDITQVVRQAVKKYAVLFVYAGLYITIDPLGEPVISDPKWLGFMIEQILSNAVKYTHKGGVHVYREGDELCIADTGIGIRREDLPRLFHKGFTGYNGRAQEASTGLGLYLCKRTADALGIRLSVRSAPGEGTEVRLCFPAVTGDQS